MVVWEQSKARLPALKEPVVHWVDRWTKDSNTIGHGLLSRGTFFQICLWIKISGDCFGKSSVGPWNNVFYLFCKSPRCGFQILDRYGNHILMGTEAGPMTNIHHFRTCIWENCAAWHISALPDTSLQSNQQVWWSGWVDWTAGKWGGPGCWASPAHRIFQGSSPRSRAPSFTYWSSQRSTWSLIMETIRYHRSRQVGGKQTGLKN